MKQLLKHLKGSQAGFTLLEVLIAIVVLGIGLLLLSGAQITTIRSNSSGFKTTTSVALADNRIQELQNLSFLDPDLTDGNHSDPDTSVNNVVYSMSYNVADNIPVVGMKTITYTASWEDAGSHSINLITRKGN